MIYLVTSKYHNKFASYLRQKYNLDMFLSLITLRDLTQPLLDLTHEATRDLPSSVVLTSFRCIGLFGLESAASLA